jgi:hypothetical protein
VTGKASKANTNERIPQLFLLVFKGKSWI